MAGIGVDTPLVRRNVHPVGRHAPDHGRRPADRPFNEAERATGLIESESFCLNVNRSGTLRRIDDESLRAWSGGVSDKRVRWRSMNAPTPPDNAVATERVLRPSDFDLFDHMNNACYWHIVDCDEGQYAPITAGPHRAVVIEYIHPVPPCSSITVRTGWIDDSFGLWFVHDGRITTSVVLRPLVVTGDGVPA